MVSAAQVGVHDIPFQDLVNPLTGLIRFDSDTRLNFAEQDQTFYFPLLLSRPYEGTVTYGARKKAGAEAFTYQVLLSVTVRHQTGETSSENFMTALVPSQNTATVVSFLTTAMELGDSLYMTVQYLADSEAPALELVGANLILLSRGVTL